MRFIGRARSRRTTSRVLCAAFGVTVALSIALVHACGARTDLEVPRVDAGEDRDGGERQDAGECHPTDASPYDSSPPGVFCDVLDAKAPCSRWEACPRHFGPGECFACVARRDGGR